MLVAEERLLHPGDQKQRYRHVPRRYRRCRRTSSTGSILGSCAIGDWVQSQAARPRSLALNPEARTSSLRQTWGKQMLSDRPDHRRFDMLIRRAGSRRSLRDRCRPRRILTSCSWIAFAGEPKRCLKLDQICKSDRDRRPAPCCSRTGHGFGAMILQGGERLLKPGRERNRSPRYDRPVQICNGDRLYVHRPDGRESDRRLYARRVHALQQAEEEELITCRRARPAFRRRPP